MQDIFLNTFKLINSERKKKFNCHYLSYIVFNANFLENLLILYPENRAILFCADILHGNTSMQRTWNAFICYICLGAQILSCFLFFFFALRKWYLSEMASRIGVTSLLLGWCACNYVFCLFELRINIPLTCERTTTLNQ